MANGMWRSLINLCNYYLTAKTPTSSLHCVFASLAHQFMTAT
ncbi:MAG: hypothetical protein RMY31_031500 [Dendronalium sp. ChiSLP03b]|nr:hypothetical protein [Dendronalium sp. ChiSLP03b]